MSPAQHNTSFIMRCDTYCGCAFEIVRDHATRWTAPTTTIEIHFQMSEQAWLKYNPRSRMLLYDIKIKTSFLFMRRQASNSIM